MSIYQKVIINICFHIWKNQFFCFWHTVEWCFYCILYVWLLYLFKIYIREKNSSVIGRFLYALLFCFIDLIWNSKIEHFFFSFSFFSFIRNLDNCRVENKLKKKKKKRIQSLFHSPFFLYFILSTDNNFIWKWIIQGEGGGEEHIKKTQSEKKREIMRLHACNSARHWISTWVTEILLSCHHKYIFRKRRHTRQVIVI
jgi:hypothetical protein